MGIFKSPVCIQVHIKYFNSVIIAFICCLLNLMSNLVACINDCYHDHQLLSLSQRLYSIMYITLDCIVLFVISDIYFDIGCTPAISGLPKIPGYPIVGNLFQLGKSPALTFLKWSGKYGDVYQLRLGNKRVIVVNSYTAATQLWIHNMSANCSRPITYTFHHVVSQSQGYTIGTTPWSATYRKLKKIASKALNKPAIVSYSEILDLESAECIQSISRGVAKQSNISIHSYFNAYSLNIGLTLNYGTRSTDPSRLAEIISVEKQIGKFRSIFPNYLDYLPFLNLVAYSTKSAVESRQRRDVYMKELLDQLEKNILKGQCHSCITGNILQANENTVSEGELRSICLTMVSAGLETIPSILIYFIGYMSQPYGQKYQEIAYQSLIERYKSCDEAWKRCLVDKLIPFIRALLAETLRISSMPISLPRETIQDISFNGIIIPKKTSLILNTLATHFDETHYTCPFSFLPGRFLKFNEKGHYEFKISKGPSHFAFGAGKRMCAGAALAERELYVAVVRFICMFKILPPDNPNDLMVTNPLEIFACQKSLVIDPPFFKVKLVSRTQF